MFELDTRKARALICHSLYIVDLMSPVSWKHHRYDKIHKECFEKIEMPVG
jgi:hypothetical protein